MENPTRQANPFASTFAPIHLHGFNGIMPWFVSQSLIGVSSTKSDLRAVLVISVPSSSNPYCKKKSCRSPNGHIQSARATCLTKLTSQARHLMGVLLRESGAYGTVYSPDHSDSDARGSAYLDSIVFSVAETSSTTDDHVNITLEPPEDPPIEDNIHVLGPDSGLRGYDWSSDYSSGSSPAPSSNGSSFEDTYPDVLASSSMNHTTFLPDHRALTSYLMPSYDLYRPFQEMSFSTHVPPPSLSPSTTGSPGPLDSQNSRSPQAVSSPDAVSFSVDNGQQNGYCYDTDISLIVNMPVGNHLGDGLDYLPALESQATVVQNSSSSGLACASSSKEVVNTTRRKVKRGRNKEAIIAARRKRDANYACKECGKAFTCAARLKDHHNSDHLHLVIPCDACSNSYSHGTSLRRHWREKHPELVFRASSSNF
ncbi:hypothetical protein BDZ89DRAFT_356201 [Hymenopellis radicata]|nr:hypothetical protein BDZ89DRAFT_356201 [Hymenopellis radicata]